MKSKGPLRLAMSIVLCQLTGVLGSLFTTPAIPTWYRIKEAFLHAPRLDIWSGLDQSIYTHGSISIHGLAEARSPRVQIDFDFFPYSVDLQYPLVNAFFWTQVPSSWAH